MIYVLITLREYEEERIRDEPLGVVKKSSKISWAKYLVCHTYIAKEREDNSSFQLSCIHPYFSTKVISCIHTHTFLQK